MPNYISAQVTFTGTLWSDGTVHITESGCYREGYLRKYTHYHQNHDTEASADYQDLAYTLWSEMEPHL